jgi:hypothetical protein
MNAIKLTGIVAAGALLASSAAFAGPKWTYVEGAFTQGSETNPGGGSSNDTISNDYYQLGGSFGFMDMYHVGAQYYTGTAGNQPGTTSDWDFDGYEINFGVNPAITDDTDFVTNIFYTDLNFDTVSACNSSSCRDTDGYGVKVGLRSMITDNLEMSAYGIYADYSIDGQGSDTFADGITTWAEIGGQYYWTEAFSVGLDAILGGPLQGENSTALRFSARWSF